jgi:hypothetical protein
MIMKTKATKDLNFQQPKADICSGNLNLHPSVLFLHAVPQRIPTDTT